MEIRRPWKAYSRPAEPEIVHLLPNNTYSHVHKILRPGIIIRKQDESVYSFTAHFHNI